VCSHSYACWQIFGRCIFKDPSIEQGLLFFPLSNFTPRVCENVLTSASRIAGREYTSSRRLCRLKLVQCSLLHLVAPWKFLNAFNAVTQISYVGHISVLSINLIAQLFSSRSCWTLVALIYWQSSATSRSANVLQKKLFASTPLTFRFKFACKASCMSLHFKPSP